MSSIQSILNKPITIPKESTVNDVIKELTNKKISRLLVSEGGKFTSIITEKDLGIFLLTDESERNLSQIPISEIMKPLQSVSSSSSIKECAKTMIENSIGSLAINSGETTDGIITKTDLAKYFVENNSGKKIVGEYATLYYAWAYSDTPLHKVVRKMIDEKISRIILKNHNELPEGILTFRDLFRIALEEGNVKEIADNTDPVISVVFTRKGFLSETGFGATTTAKQIMTDKIISVRYDDDLAKACNLLLDNKINAVGVLSSKGRLVGILSKSDVTRAVAFMN
jgi:CBS domain-containing protein